MERLPFERARDQGAGEALADPRRLRQVEIAPASAGNRAQPFELVRVRLPELLAGEATDIVDPAQNDQGADLGAPRESIELAPQLCARIVLVTQDRERDEQLGRNPVAPKLDHLL